MKAVISDSYSAEDLRAESAIHCLDEVNWAEDRQL